MTSQQQQQQLQQYPAPRPVSYSSQQQDPPPVPKKPSMRERQRHRQMSAGENEDGNGYPGGSSGLHQNPQKLKNSALRDDQQQVTSPWLDKQLQQQQQQQPNQRHQPTEQDRSDPAYRRYQMESELDDLKAENRAKTRELDTNKYIEKEMNRKLKIADDAYMLRHLIKDKERQIANQEKIIADLTEDNSKLGEDIADKERTIFQLQSEVDNLDRIIVAKNALKETERLQAVGDELDRAKDDLASIELEVDGAKAEIKNLQNQLTRKDREVRAKGEQLDNLNKEVVEAKSALANLENEKAVSDNHHRASERENNALKEQVEKLSDYRERCRNLEEENAYIAEAVRALEAKVFHLETVKRDKEALEELVHDLKAALKDKNKVLKDRRDLLIETQQLKDVLREKSTDEAGLHKELGKLKDVLNELEKENDFYRDLESDFHKIKKRYEDLEKDKFKNELLVAKLRPKMERLQQRCKEKDDLIRRMANELRGGGERLPRELLLEADQNQRKTLDDYVDPIDYTNMEEPLSDQIMKSHRQPNNRPPLSPMPQQPQKLQQGPQQPAPQHRKTASYEPAPPASPKAAYEPRLSSQQQQPQYQPPQQFQSKYQPQNEPQQLSAYQPYQPNTDSQQQPQYQSKPQSQNQPQQDNYPTYSRSLGRNNRGQQTPDEPVRLYPSETGDHQLRASDPQPSGGMGPDRRLAQQPYGSQDPYSAPAAPEDVMRPSRAGRDQSQPRPTRVGQADYEPSAHRPQLPTRLLDPPINLRISRVLGDGSVMLEWESPQLDALDRNNGVVVAGYKVFVNGVEEQSVVSCRLTKSLIPKSSLGVLTSFGIQTFGYDGEASEKVEIPAGEAAGVTRPSAVGRGRSPLRVDTQPTGQETSQHYPYQSQRSPSPNHANQPKDEATGIRRRAVRDYHPSDESPSAFPSYELELRRGDQVMTFGPMRPDGMFNAEINGHRGLVPAQYLELTS